MRIVSSLVLLASLASAWVTPPAAVSRVAARGAPLSMALDYNDPVVGAEFAQVQTLSYEEVEEELSQNGVGAPPTMNEMDLKLMLVELRLVMSGALKGEEKQAPTTFSTAFEEALYTKPVFKEYYEKLKEKGDVNAMNVVSEFVNDPDMAESRYGKTYRGVLRNAKKALTAAMPVTTPTIAFSGFPANMGEAGCQMTLQAVGEIMEFECFESEDLPILEGRVTFEDIDTAKKAVEQYDGMDMGMGTKLEMKSV